MNALAVVAGIILTEHQHNILVYKLGKTLPGSGATDYFNLIQILLLLQFKSGHYCVK